MLLLAEWHSSYKTKTGSCSFWSNGVNYHLKHLSMEKAGWAAMLKPDLCGMSEGRSDEDDDVGNSRKRQGAQGMIRWQEGCWMAKLSEVAVIHILNERFVELLNFSLSIWQHVNGWNNFLSLVFLCSCTPGCGWCHFMQLQTPCCCAQRAYPSSFEAWTEHQPEPVRWEGCWITEGAHWLTCWPLGLLIPH